MSEDVTRVLSLSWDKEGELVRDKVSIDVKLRGRCIACGTRSLFVGSGGYITCSLRECPNPGAVTDFLNRPQHHVIEFGKDGWALQHEVTCFPNLLDCELHERISLWMDTQTGPPVPPGYYQVRESDLKLTPVVSSG